MRFAAFGALVAGAAAVALLAPPAVAREAARMARGPINWVSWEPGDRILFNARRGLYSIRRDEARLRWHAGGSDGVWSPSGQHIAFEFADGISVVAERAGRARRLRRDGSWPAWSPGGDRIAYEVSGLVDDAGGIWIVRPNGSGARRIAPTQHGSGVWAGPSWEPSGARIVYQACLRMVPDIYSCDMVTGATGVFTVDASGRGKRRIARGFCPVWGRGGLIAYAEQRRLSTVVVRPDGAGRRVIVSRSIGCPRWSPDGRRVAVETAGGLVVAQADGSSRRLVARLPRPPRDVSAMWVPRPAWSPDGGWIAVSRHIGRSPRTAYQLYVIRVRDGGKRVIVRTPFEQ